MAYANRKFAIYVKAVSPVYTYQLMFSENPIQAEAEQEVLAEFDSSFPTAIDRKIDKVVEYSKYLEVLNQMDSLNYYMAS